MKNLGKTLNKTQQKQIKGGGIFTLCPRCTDTFFSTVNPAEGDVCSRGGFPTGVCIGTIQNGLCCFF